MASEEPDGRNALRQRPANPGAAGQRLPRTPLQWSSQPRPRQLHPDFTGEAEAKAPGIVTDRNGWMLG